MKLTKINEKDKNYTLYEYIKISCLRQNNSIGDLCRSTGLAYKTIRNLKEKKPRMSTYIKIANYFNIISADLYELDIKKEEV